VAKSTKPKSATNYKQSFTTYRETAFGILPRAKVVELEKQGIKKAQQYILKLSDKRTKISANLQCTQERIRLHIPQMGRKAQN